MAATITEERTVSVRADETTFTFVADPDRGRLVIEEHPEGEEPSTVCALTIDDMGELEGFLAGLHRVLGRPTEPAPAPVAPPPRRDDPADEERIRRARQKNPKAFAAWSKDEERRLEAAYRRGEPLEQIADEHGRSRRAVELRLAKLGLRDPDGG